MRLPSASKSWWWRTGSRTFPYSSLVPAVELLQLEPVVDDRLQQVERAHRVRHHGLVRPVPRLADVCLCGEVEDVGAVVGPAQHPDDAVDRVTVGQVAPVDGDVAPEVADVVESAARSRTHERVNARAEEDERIGDVRAHEAVGARHEGRAAGVDVAELTAERLDRAARPEWVRALRHSS
jgi:hypothetical protein